MTKTWTFDGTEDIIQELGHVIAELREGTIVFHNLEVGFVMNTIKNEIIENAEIGDDND